MMMPLFGKHIFLAMYVLLCLFLRPVSAEESGEDTLGLYSSWEEQSVSASRASKPLSHTPENVTVVTAREIEALNAHTLADVLATVSGIQLENLAYPGGVVFTNIQGSQFSNVLVLMDGVPLNNLADNFPDVGLVPARIIERIEIVKGAASSAWGQALGGVINVITKSPQQGRLVGGSASASLGSRLTTDNGAEVGGTSGRIGYYLSGGYLGSNGLLPNNQIFSNNAYAKLTYELPSQGQVNSTFSYTRAARGELASQLYDVKADDAEHYLNATLGYRTPLSEQVELQVNTYHTSRQIDILETFLDSGLTVRQSDTHEDVSGVNLKLVWRTTDNLLVTGSDYLHAEFSLNNALEPVNNSGQTADRWGVYLNDTFTLGPLSLSSGARFDHTQSNGDQFSPTIGFTWQLAETTVLRGYTAKGYSLPALTQDINAESVWASQIGIESGAIPYLWFKETLFRNETWNVFTTDPQTGATDLERHIALGSETEFRTTPVYDTSLGAGYTFTDTTRTSDGSQVKGVPRHTLQLALRYDDHNAFRALLTGRHIWWNTDPSQNGRYYGLIWDLHLGATLFKRENSSLELFVSGHNLFNNSQFTDQLYPNPGRWYEGGLKVRF
ncbi:MAG: TonB-dependent receptor [Oryzomonas sp.]|jgi:vitamin B12 transporter